MISFWIINKLIVKKEPQVTEKITPTPPEFKVENQEENNVFKIQIPKIMAVADIVTGVSPFDPKEYLKVLENDVVAQAKETSLPGDGPGTSMYVFAHSTQQGWRMSGKNSVFYLLGELENGDLVYIDYKGKIYTYQVYMQKIVNAVDVEYLSYREDGEELLILQTCWPIGTDWRRLLIFAKLVK